MKQQIKILVNNKDISPYLVDATWAGDNTSASRRVDFSIAYNTPVKDSTFNNLDIELGDKIKLMHGDITLFSGVVFMASRNSNSYTKKFTAYDPLIYLAKSTINKKFKNITVLSVLEQVANDFNLKIKLDDGLQLNTIVNFIADNKKATEVFKQALDFQTAIDKIKYQILGTDEENNIFIGSNKTQDVTAFKLSADLNVMESSHSESIEDMVNHIDILNDHGEIVGAVENQEDISKYGKIISSYKIDGKQETIKQAKSLLKSIKPNSTIKTTGNFFCVSGKNIEIQEENLKGKFFIISDSHEFSNNNHSTNLTVQFTEFIEAPTTITNAEAINKADQEKKAQQAKQQESNKEA